MAERAAVAKVAEVKEGEKAAVSAAATVAVVRAVAETEEAAPEAAALEEVALAVVAEVAKEGPRVEAGQKTSWWWW